MHSLSKYYFEKVKWYINQYYYIEKSYVKRNDKTAQKLLYQYKAALFYRRIARKRPWN